MLMMIDVPRGVRPTVDDWRAARARYGSSSAQELVAALEEAPLDLALVDGSARDRLEPALVEARLRGWCAPVVVVHRRLPETRAEWALPAIHIEVGSDRAGWHAVIPGALSSAVARSAIDVAGGRLDLAAGVFFGRASPVALTATEARLVRFLALREGQVVDRAELLERVWLRPTQNPRTVDFAVQRVRKKIETDPASPRVIVSHWGAGYELVIRPVLDPPDADARTPGSGEPRPTWLPTRRLFGDQATRRRMSEMLDAGGLALLVGPGGVGKTTIARAFVADWLRGPGPRWARQVDAVDCRIVGVLLERIAGALGVRVPPDIEKGTAALTEVTRSGCDRLILIDAADHVIDLAAPILRGLVADTRLSLVITSRRGPDGLLPTLPVSRLSVADAVQLFLDRAGDGLRVPADHAVVALVERIMRHTFRSPLEIQALAALLCNAVEREGQTVALRQLAALVIPPDAAEDESIQWTLTRLWASTPLPERRLLSSCAVCRGGFTIEEAEGLASDLVDVLGTIESLHGRFLVTSRLGAHGEIRLLIPEHVRAFALEQLDPIARAEVERSHAEFFAAHAERLLDEFYRGRFRNAHKPAAQFANFEQALEYLNQHEPARTRRLAAAMGEFFVQSACLPGWGQQLDRLKRLLSDLPEVSRLPFEMARIRLLGSDGTPGAALAQAEALVEEARTVGDPLSLARCLHVRDRERAMAGRTDDDLYSEALSWARRANSPVDEALIEANRVMILAAPGRYRSALDRLDALVERCERIGLRLPALRIRAYTHQLMSDLGAGDCREAALESLQTGRWLWDARIRFHAYVALIHQAVEHGDVEAAEAFAADLGREPHLQSTYSSGWLLLCHAVVALAAGRVAEALGAYADLHDLALGAGAAVWVHEAQVYRWVVSRMSGELSAGLPDGSTILDDVRTNARALDLSAHAELLRIVVDLDLAPKQGPPIRARLEALLARDGRGDHTVQSAQLRSVVRFALGTLTHR